MLKKLHRYNALILVFFLTIHFLNHLMVIGGIAAHIQAQAMLRTVYRLPVLEPVLLALFAMQIGLGIALVIKRGRPKGGWAWVQVMSGLYLVVFLVQHLGAILMARAGGLDTNSYFAAAVVSRAPYWWYFAPYYTLGLMAVFAHIAAAWRFHIWPAQPSRSHYAVPFVGFAIGGIAVAGLMGAFGAFDLPEPYQAYLEALPF